MLVDDAKCPFCGVGLLVSETPDGSFQGRCRVCGARGPRRLDKPEAIHAFTRPAAADRRVAECRESALVCAECLGSGGVVRANGEHHDGATSSYETSTCPTCSGRGLTFGQVG